MCFLSRIGRLSRNFFRGASHDVQGVDPASHERCDRCIDQAMALELRSPLESARNQGYPKVAAFPGARMTGVMSAVVENLDGGRRQLAHECGPDLRDQRAVSHAGGG